MVCSSAFQASLYVQNGGQPAHLNAWKNPLANELTYDFFRTNLPAMARGYVRPRYNGYLHFQDRAGIYIHDFLMGKISNGKTVINEINNIYHQSLAHQNELVA